MAIVQERSNILRKKRVSKKPTTVAEFEQWEVKKKSDYNYEFYYGEIIKKPGMKQIKIWILKFLNRQFLKTNAHKIEGELFTEVDVYIDEFRKRIPDLAFFTEEQILASAKGIKVVTCFCNRNFITK